MAYTRSDLAHDFRAVAGKIGSTMWHWPASFWSTFLPRLEKLGYITNAEHEEFMAMWTASGEDKDCFVMLPPVFDLIAIRT